MLYVRQDLHGSSAVFGALLAATSGRRGGRRDLLGQGDRAAGVLPDAGTVCSCMRCSWRRQASLADTYLVALVFFAQGIPVLIFTVAAATVRQALIPEGLLARVSAIFYLAGAGMAPLGLLAGGLIGTYLGLRATFLVGAAGLAPQWFCSAGHSPAWIRECPGDRCHARKTGGWTARWRADLKGLCLRGHASGALERACAVLSAARWRWAGARARRWVSGCGSSGGRWAGQPVAGGSPAGWSAFLRCLGRCFAVVRVARSTRWPADGAQSWPGQRFRIGMQPPCTWNPP